jgi:hypothetical protein
MSVVSNDSPLINVARIDYGQLVNWSPLIVDTRNTIDSEAAKGEQLWKA